MGIIHNTLSAYGLNAPTFWKLTGIEWDICKHGKVAIVTISGYASPMQCNSDPERYSLRLDAKTYTVPSGEMTAFSESDAYSLIKMQGDFSSNCLDCLDWAEWTPIRWRSYCNAVANNETVDYILDKTLWEAYLITITP